MHNVVYPSLGHGTLNIRAGRNFATYGQRCDHPPDVYDSVFGKSNLLRLVMNLALPRSNCKSVLFHHCHTALSRETSNIQQE